MSKPRFIIRIAVDLNRNISRPLNIVPSFNISGGEPPATRSIVAYSWARRLALDYRPSKDCEGNGTVARTSDMLDLPGPNWFETISGQLFLYSAHLDTRLPGYPSIRVIGVKRGPLRASALFCTIW